MNEPQQAETYISKFGTRGIVIETKVPLKFFEKHGFVEVTGTISFGLENQEGKTLDFLVSLPCQSERALIGESNPPTSIPFISNPSSISESSSISSNDAKQLIFCACDDSRICLTDPVVSSSDPIMQVCITATPTNAVLNITFGAILHSKELPVPDLEFEYDAEEKNKAVAISVLPPEFFQEDQLGEVAVFVKGDIFVVGFRKGQAAFKLDYKLRTATESPTSSPSETVSPTGTPSLGAVACVCNQYSNSCMDGSDLSFGIENIHICVL